MDLSGTEGISSWNQRHPRAHRGADSGDHASKEAKRGPLHMFPRLGQRLWLAPTRRALLTLRLAASSGRPKADPQRHLPEQSSGIRGRWRNDRTRPDGRHPARRRSILHRLYLNRRAASPSAEATPHYRV